MKKNKNLLVVGGDSLVGAHLYRSLIEDGYLVSRTTRRQKPEGQNWVYFDFTDVESYKNAREYDQAFIVAAATNYERCATDPMARRINVELIPEAIIKMMELGLFCSYISTNSVFGGNQRWPKENAKHNPLIPYAEQKSESEVKLRDLSAQRSMTDRCNVIRLTKIMDFETPPVPGWLKSLTSGHIITPFEDLIFAPMSVQHVAKAIAKVGLLEKPGDFHLSGAKNVTYVDFAQEFIKQFNFNPQLLEPVVSTEKGITIAFKPKYSGLGMEKTSRLAGVMPQTLESVVSDLKVSCEQANGIT
ncbi:sugar nucleotide-binding protein [Alphaproteobacteria bacterium]|nr:sugar nucleotide-binding protein [Alphaproteobacteria bacterium]